MFGEAFVSTCVSANKTKLEEKWSQIIWASASRFVVKSRWEPKYRFDESHNDDDDDDDDNNVASPKWKPSDWLKILSSLQN